MIVVFAIVAGVFAGEPGTRQERAIVSTFGSPIVSSYSAYPGYAYGGVGVPVVSSYSAYPSAYYGAYNYGGLPLARAYY